MLQVRHHNAVLTQLTKRCSAISAQHGYVRLLQIAKQNCAVAERLVSIRLVLLQTKTQMMQSDRCMPLSGLLWRRSKPLGLKLAMLSTLCYPQSQR